MLDQETLQAILGIKDAVVNAYPKSKSARAYKEIAAKIMGVNYDSRKDRENWIDVMFRNSRKKR